MSCVAGAAIAIAVEMRWAITQPTIFSRWRVDVVGIRKRYALEHLRTDSVRGGDARVKLIVSRRCASWDFDDQYR